MMPFLWFRWLKHSFSFHANWITTSQVLARWSAQSERKSDPTPVTAPFFLYNKVKTATHSLAHSIVWLSAPAVMVCTFTSYRSSLSGPSWYQIRSRKCHVYCCCVAELNQWMTWPKCCCLHWTRPGTELSLPSTWKFKFYWYWKFHRLKNAC